MDIQYESFLLHLWKRFYIQNWGIWIVYYLSIDLYMCILLQKIVFLEI